MFQYWGSFVCFNLESGYEPTILLLKYKSTLSVHLYVIEKWMTLESTYITSYPSQHLYTLSGRANFSLQIQETIIKPRQSIWAFLCVNIYMEMIDSALCKWTLCEFCRLMGLEPSQKRSTLWTVDVYPNLDKQLWDVALIYLICRHQQYGWTW